MKTLTARRVQVPVASSLKSKLAILLVICGPFACGKNAVIDALIASGGFTRCVSVTTRPLGEGEVNGVDYIVVTREKFIYMRDVENVFLESAEIHGNLYGTLKKDIETKLENGESVIIHIDMQGIETLKRYGSDFIRDRLLTIYLEVDLVTSIERARNRKGRSMSDTEIVRRIITRESEEEKKHICSYRIANPNGVLEETVYMVRNIVRRRQIEIECDR